MVLDLMPLSGQGRWVEDFMNAVDYIYQAKIFRRTVIVVLKSQTTFNKN